MRYLAASLILAVAASSAPAQEVTFTKIKYDALAKVIESHKGKVVVVDFWATY